MARWPIFLAALSVSVAPERAGDSKVPAAATPAGDPSVSAVELEATRVMTRYCGGCHESSSPNKKVAALKVFDLSHEGWVHPLSDERLTKLIDRLQSKASREEVEPVSALIKTERARRGPL